jgi:hypothetical protein
MDPVLLLAHQHTDDFFFQQHEINHFTRVFERCKFEKHSLLNVHTPIMGKDLYKMQR